jgi:hypothetical protein
MAYRTPKDLAESLSRRRKAAAADDGYVREIFTLPRQEARERAPIRHGTLSFIKISAAVVPATHVLAGRPSIPHGGSEPILIVEFLRLCLFSVFVSGSPSKL